jgi:hypothetical protein
MTAKAPAKFAIPLGLAAALLTSACLPVTSLHPIGSTAATAPDPALAGAWRGKMKDATAPGTLYFLPQKDGGATALFITDPGKKDAGNWSSFAVTTATLGANHFINARELLDEGKPAEGRIATTTFPLLYRISNASLTLYLLDEKKIAAAIAAGKLKGTVEKGVDGDVAITQDAATLDAFMASKAGAGLFGPPLMVLHKLP